MQDVPEMLSRPFPRAPLVGAAVIVGFSLALVTMVRLSGVDVAQPTGRAVTVRELHFVDRRDGGIVVSDAAAGDRVVDIVSRRPAISCAPRCAAWRASGCARISVPMFRSA